ncbi:MAG: alpha/beta hydrolase [Gammaproteobacteria bacterium]
MSLHPQAQAIVDAANAAGVPFEADDYRAMRKGYAATTAQYRHAGPPLESVVDLVFPGPASDLAVRLYHPRRGAQDGVPPVLVYCHGGGWVVGSLDTHDHLCRYLAGTADCAIVALDYRLAPEHPFPAAFDDAVACVRWVARGAAELGVDPARIAVGGDSAGGNLAAASALALRGEVALALQLLIYPAVDLAADNASLRDNARGYLLTRAAMAQFTDWYLGDRALVTDWRASFMHADNLAGAAAALIQTAGYDPLRDEAIAYAERLVAAGVTVTHDHYPDMIHGFARMGGRIDTGIVALDRAAAALRRAFAA